MQSDPAGAGAGDYAEERRRFSTVAYPTVSRYAPAQFPVLLQVKSSDKFPIQLLNPFNAPRAEANFCVVACAPCPAHGDFMM
jgi:hypothetical protein